MLFNEHDLYLAALGTTLADELSNLTEEEQTMVLIWMLDRLSEDYGVDSMKLAESFTKVFRNVYPTLHEPDDDHLELFYFTDENDEWSDI